MMFFNKYRNIILGIVFIVYSIFLWSTSAKVASTVYQQKEIELQQEILKEKARQDKLADSIGKVLDDKLSKITITNTYITKEVRSEIDKNPQYRDCRHTPSVMRNIGDAYNNAKTASK